MAKEVDLLSYWMPILRQLKEFKEIAKAETPELKYLLEACDRTLANMFIETADEYGIARFESMMGIYPEAGASLETRRFNVLVKWNDKVPYTDKELYNRLLSLCGSEEAFTIDPHYNEYKINITTELGVKGAFDAVASLLVEMLPCNLVLTLENFLFADKVNPLSVGVALSVAKVYQITHDINKQYTANAPHNVGIGISKANTHVITNDIESKVDKVTPLSEAVAVSNAFSGVITHDVSLEDNLTGDAYNAVGVGVAQTKLITHDVALEPKLQGNNAVATPMSTATVITIKS